MISKRFEYLHKDISMLKKDIVLRSLFSVLFLAIFVWQFVMIIVETVNKTMHITKVITSVVVLISTLLLLLINLVYIFRSFKIISVIKTRGKCVSSVSILFRTNKPSFIKLYSLLMQALTLIISLVLISSITYTILQASYLSFISFYMPILFMVCISGYNSIYHIQTEIETQQKVLVYNGY